MQPHSSGLVMREPFQACLIAASLLFSANVVSAQSGARFEDAPPVAELDRTGRTLTLLKPFAFHDASGRVWRVPTGAVTDGASIPKLFWSIIGGPLEGKYRWAAIIHDRYCDVRTRSWQDTHKVFYEAMLAAETPPKTAWLMFKAVERFGPRWNPPVVDPKCLDSRGQIDLDKCAENSLGAATSVVHPSQTTAELQDFLNSVEPGSDPSDIKKLREAILNR
jgi:Protein of unknown function (DUF1353)